MDLKLRDKIIVVSNVTNEIGKSIVKLLANENAVPVIIGQQEDDNLSLVNELTAAGKRCFYVVAELTQPDTCKDAIDNILNEFKRIDGLINNDNTTESINLENGNIELFTQSLHQNIMPFFLLTQYALPALKISKGPIINIISTNKKTGKENNVINAVTALTREWAVDLLKYEIRVNAVITETLNPVIEINDAKAEEITNAIVFLLSERSNHTTGQLIHV